MGVGNRGHLRGSVSVSGSGSGRVALSATGPEQCAKIIITCVPSAAAPNSELAALELQMELEVEL